MHFRKGHLLVIPLEIAHLCEKGHIERDIFLKGIKEIMPCIRKLSPNLDRVCIAYIRVYRIKVYLVSVDFLKIGTVKATFHSLT